MNEKMIQKAKEAKSAEELLALAKENKYPLTEEEAQELFAQLHGAAGELTDAELDNVVGGGCKTKGGYTVVTIFCNCFTGQFKPAYESDTGKLLRTDHSYLRDLWSGRMELDSINHKYPKCSHCYHLEFNGGIGYCGVSKK